MTDRSPEAVWVTVSGCEGNVFVGRVLNQPHQLQTVQEGAQIKFVASSDGQLLMVTDKYLSERSNWDIQPCQQCGLDELFDAPSDLMRVIFPDIPADANMGMFTSFCGACGGVQVVQDANGDFADEPAPALREKRWWQFWK